jgi:hypothetical protein
MPVSEMLERMSSRELTDWQGYYQSDPWGEQRADWRAGMICAVIANSFRDPKKGKTFKPEDFMPRIGKKKGGQTTEDQLGMVRHLHALFNSAEKPGPKRS